MCSRSPSPACPRENYGDLVIKTGSFCQTTGFAGVSTAVSGADAGDCDWPGRLRGAPGPNAMTERGNVPFTNFLIQQRLFMKVLVINNDGGGFADYVEAPEGTTVRDLFQREVRSGKPENYLIRVNRLPAGSDQVLREGDRISFTPIKVEGAR